MNNKGFAYTTIIYAILLILSLSMLASLAIVSNTASNTKEFGNEIDQELEQCYYERTC